jgi:bacterioferritin
MDIVGNTEQIRARARQKIEEGAVTKDYGLDQEQVVGILNEVLSTEFHQFMASGINAPGTSSAK